LIKLDLTLYFITDSTNINESDFLRVVESACEGGITLLQLREKEKTTFEYLKIAEKVKRISDRYGIPLIIDDRVDIAMAIDAAGVHVGQSDMPVYIARKLLGKDKIVGATAKTPERAKEAKEEGADYFGVGAIYPTTTKVITRITEVTTLNEIALQTKVPLVAIGGLNAENMHVLYNSMANGIAVVSAIMKSGNPCAAAKALKKQVLENFQAVGELL
jgi:thiamine-phosphate pyrophosphorylase